MQKIGLGTVQFGLNYGVSNTRGKVPFEGVKEILDTAFKAGMDTLDTAIGYGDSEEVLGKTGVKSWKVISKLPTVPNNCNNISGWIEQQVQDSLSRLDLNCLNGLLIHDPDDLYGPNRKLIINTLLSLKKENVVKKIGLSIYDPAEIETIIDQFPIDILQAPMSIVDRRLLSNKSITNLKENGCEIHIRSIFLQGLLLMNSLNRPIYFDRWKNLWSDWDNWLKSENLTGLEACLSYALGRSFVDRIIIGVSSREELDQILSISDKLELNPPKALESTDSNLINPSKWEIS